MTLPPRDKMTLTFWHIFFPVSFSMYKYTDIWICVYMYLYDDKKDHITYTTYNLIFLMTVYPKHCCISLNNFQ